MKSESLIQHARTLFLHLRREERNSINPYASFADQVIALIHSGRISTKADVIRYTRMSYHRPRMNRQWRTFGKVIDKGLPPLPRNSLLYFFGFLKRLLTIEGKKELEERNRNPKEFDNRNRYNKRSHHRYHR
jgi:hypothetical protein